MSLTPKESGIFISCLSKHVKVKDEGIQKLSEEVLNQLDEGVIKMDLITKKECYPSLPDAALVDWAFLIDTLNYCFWTPGKGKWTITWKDNEYSGYFALCAAISKALENGIQMYNPKVYSNLSEQQISEIFQGPDKKIPMLESRKRNLFEVGQILIRKYNGTFVNCVLKAEKSAVALLKIITSEFECFNDVAEYEGKTVSFHKRAQILIADLWTLFEGKGFGEFTDIDQITMFADYRVPQTLVHFGALEYSEELMTALKSDAILDRGHPYEVEIRGCSIQVVERVSDEVEKKLKAAGKNHLCNSILIDNYLWMYRRDHAVELNHIPFHKVTSIFY